MFNTNQYGFGQVRVPEKLNAIFEVKIQTDDHVGIAFTGRSNNIENKKIDYV